MKDSIVKLAQNIIFALTIAAAVVFPLFFIPTTSEFFEYNKFFALLIITILGLIIWSVKMIAEKRTVFTRTPLDAPLIIMGIIFLISAFSSIDQFISIYGVNGRIWPSIVPLITLFGFYFMAVSNIKNRKQVNIIIYALVGATTIASLVALTSYFGAFLPFEFAKIRSFNTVGIINNLAIIQTIVIPIAVSWGIYEKDRTSRIVATVSALIMALSFILINLLMAYVGLIVALLFLGVGALKIRLTKSQQGHAAVIAVFIALFLVIRFIPQVATGTLYQWIISKDPGATQQQQIDTPKQTKPSFQTAWDIAAQSIGKRPIVGTGLGTYQFV